MPDEDFVPPSRAQRMIVEHFAGEPCECSEAAKKLDTEAGDVYFMAVACKPCRSRKVLEAVRKEAERACANRQPSSNVSTLNAAHLSARPWGCRCAFT